MSGKHATALEWLEQGRSVVLGQLLNLRTPMDELRNAGHALAERAQAHVRIPLCRHN
jgi:hypothetical protein